VLRLGSQPGANDHIDEADDQAIEQLVQKMGKFFPKQYNSTEMGIPAVYPSAINSGKGAREVSMFGHSFDSFYHVCAKASD
jgi:hypothetical protein